MPQQISSLRIVTPSAKAEAPPAGNLGASVTALLKGLGVERSEQRLTAEETVQQTLQERGHDARVAELRWGRLVIEATPAAARLLGFDRDMLLEALQESAPGLVDEVRIRTVRT